MFITGFSGEQYGCHSAYVLSLFVVCCSVAFTNMDPRLLPPLKHRIGVFVSFPKISLWFLISLIRFVNRKHVFILFFNRHVLLQVRNLNIIVGVFVCFVPVFIFWSSLCTALKRFIGCLKIGIILAPSHPTSRSTLYRIWDTTQQKLWKSKARIHLQSQGSCHRSPIIDRGKWT